MNKKGIRIIVVLVIMMFALSLFNINVCSTVIADENLENSAIQFLSNLYETRSEAIVNNSKVSIFLNDYSGESTELKMHEANRINFYHNWIKEFNGTIQEMHSNIYEIENSFQINNNKASIEIYEWITVDWTREKENIDVNNLLVVKELEALYQTTDDPLLKENLPYRIEELKKEYEDAPTNINSGIGVHHTVTLLRKENLWKILKDSYDEGADLTRSPDFTDSEESITQTPTSFPSFIENNSVTNDYSVLYYPQATYDPNSALSYADYCVDPSSPYLPTPYLNEDFYNLNYINFNNYNGDCANYVSQSLYKGGERMVKNMSTGAGWYYDNKNTGITSTRDPNWRTLYWQKDDSYGTSWTYVPYLKSFILSHSRGYVQPNFSYAIKGDILDNGEHVVIVYNHPSSSYVLIDGHNNDRYHCPFSDYSYEAILMYHTYPLVLNTNEDFFYCTNFPVIRAYDCWP